VIDRLQELIPHIWDDLSDASLWDSIEINKKKPHTSRAIRMYGEDRVCVHRLEPCERIDCFAHPHAWPAAVLVLSGEYIHDIGYKETFDGPYRALYREIVGQDSLYQMVHPNVWHKVQPNKPTYSIMVNGPDYLNPNPACRTTKGKDLDKMSEVDLEKLLYSIRWKLARYI
jgi:hypothetical protein